MLPIIKPGIAALFILNFVQVWHDYLWRLVVGQEKGVKTLMAGATVAAIPMLVIFLLFQRFFTSGMTAGAVKE